MQYSPFHEHVRQWQTKNERIEKNGTIYSLYFCLKVHKTHDVDAAMHRNHIEINSQTLSFVHSLHTVFFWLTLTSAHLLLSFRWWKEFDTFKHSRFAQFYSLSHKTTHTHTQEHTRSLSAHLRNKSSELAEI